MRTTSPEKIKDNIFCLISLKGVSMLSVTNKAGLAHGYLNMLNSSKGYPDLDKVLKLCEALEVPLEDLLYKDYRSALEAKEVREIDMQIARLRKRREDLTGGMLARAKERQRK